MDASLPVLAGTVSTTIFVGSVLPMLLKAARTRDLSSYSLGNMVLANAGNLVHSVYVLNLPPGPIWALHGFYLASSALMLFWYLRFSTHQRPPAGGRRTSGSTAYPARPDFRGWSRPVLDGRPAGADTRLVS